MKKKVFPVLLVCLSCYTSIAQQTANKFIQETQYLLYLPTAYAIDTLAKWPLLIFLHGSGEAGTDIEKVKVHGPPELIAKGKNFPFIVVSPQSDRSDRWNVETLHRLLQDLKKNYRVNNDKIYLTGLSMGGYGSWKFAMEYPDEFAAIAPVCGGGDTTNAWKLRHIPVWCFHGAKDDAVLPAEDENMVNATRRYNPSVKFTLFPNANHNSWDDTYNKNDSLYDWLLTQSKFYYTEKKIPLTELKKYEGRYFSGRENDSVIITVGDKGLIARVRRSNIPLKAAGNELFFISPDLSVDIRFTIQDGQVSGFVLMGEVKWLYRKM